MLRHTASHLERIDRERFSNEDQAVGRQGPACTPPGVLLKCFWRLHLMSHLVCMIFVADLMVNKVGTVTSLYMGGIGAEV